MSKIKIDPNLCTKCNICVEICPFSIYNQSEKDSIPSLINDELCVSCGHCVAICPSNAISHVDFPNGAINPVDIKKIPSDIQIFELIRSRRSIRVFNNKSVEKSKIQRIIQGACFAPSTNNIQSTQYVVLQDKKILKEITKKTADYLQDIVQKFQNPVIRSAVNIFSNNKYRSVQSQIPDYKKIIQAYNSGEDLIIHNAPLLLFFHAEDGIGCTDVNADLALQNASVMCQALGLGCFYAGYVIAVCKNNNNVHSLLKIPDNHQIYGCLAIGYPKYEFKKWINRKPSKIEWI